MSDTYVIRVCPECGEQETLHEAPPTYCLNHDDEPGRTKRPAYVAVAVPTAALTAAGRECRADEVAAEVERLRDCHERAMGALSQPGATNYERVQAAGLILNAR